MPARAIVGRTLRDATKRFEMLEKILLAGEVDEGLLRDFRASLNRVRTTAWGVQQYMDQKETGEDASSLVSILAIERVRAAYNLCNVIDEDLKNESVSFPSGTLLEFAAVVHRLNQNLSEAVKKLG